MMTPTPSALVTTPRSCFRSVGWQMATKTISVKIKIVAAFILLGDLFSFFKVFSFFLLVPLSSSEFQMMLIFNVF